MPSEELTTLTSTAERRYVAEELGEEDEEMTRDTLEGAGLLSELPPVPPKAGAHRA